MSDAKNSSDDALETRISLIDMARRDQPEAWNVVIGLYTPLIRHWAWKKGVQCPHELDNIIQEVFKRVYFKLDSFSKREGRGSFRGWLRRITHNYIYSNHLGHQPIKTIGGSNWQDQLNQIARDEPSVGSLLDSVSGDSLPVESTLIFRRIMNWVESEYTPTQTTAFKSVVIDQRPARDVAEDLKISVNVVYQTKCRILARIREVFKDVV
jgi:RNA polymerase sigma-70 factor (ECF subfamily)